MNTDSIMIGGYIIGGFALLMIGYALGWEECEKHKTSEHNTKRRVG